MNFTGSGRLEEIPGVGLAGSAWSTGGTPETFPVPLEEEAESWSRTELEPDRPEPVEEIRQDPSLIRLYLGEIGRVALLSADEEAELGRRIEEGQARLSRALFRLPFVVRDILALAEQRHRDHQPLGDLARGRLPEKRARRRPSVALGASPRPSGQAISAGWAPGRAPRSLSRSR